MFDWITGFILAGGLGAVFLLMFLENIFPPIPAELIMPLAGFAAVHGGHSLVPTVIAGTLGALAGALAWYLLGRRVGLKRLIAWADAHGRWLTLSGDDVARAHGWFRRHGGLAVFGGRLVPTIRTLISLPAGIAAMRWPLFLALTAAGSLIWTGLLAMAGAALQSRYTAVEGWLNPIANAVFGLAVAVWLWRLVRGRGQRRA